MEVSKGVLGAVAIGMFGVALPAYGDIFHPNFTVDEVHAVNGGTTSGSFAASAMMGARGHSNMPLPMNWEASITAQCATQSSSSWWPGGCNPSGMAAALRTLTGRSWIQSLWADSDQASAMDTFIASLRDHGSPAIVPIYGQADHWVAIWQVTATLNATTSHYDISNVKSYDGGPIGGLDGATNNYFSGTLSCSGATWKRDYFVVLQDIGTCASPCTADTWYNKYVLMWEPPAGQEHTNLVGNFQKAPGVFQGALTESIAQSLVWQSLTAAGINNDPQLWNGLSGGVAGTAYEVNGVAPSGERWDYFLVPIMTENNMVKAFVQIAADDGAFERVLLLPAPTSFSTITKARAEALARGALNQGETLTSGILTWDPRAHTQFAKSPTTPYYEFGVLNGAKEVGVIRVSIGKGLVSRAANQPGA